MNHNKAKAKLTIELCNQIIAKEDYPGLYRIGNLKLSCTPSIEAAEHMARKFTRRHFYRNNARRKVTTKPYTCIDGPYAGGTIYLSPYSGGRTIPFMAKGMTGYYAIVTDATASWREVQL